MRRSWLSQYHQFRQTEGRHWRTGKIYRLDKPHHTVRVLNPWEPEPLSRKGATNTQLDRIRRGFKDPRTGEMVGGFDWTEMGNE